MKNIITSIRLFLVLTIITGVAYPLLVTQIGKSFFPKEASGSLITVNGQVVGSELIGQKFKDPKYFWPRPSTVDYNPLPSGASNLGPTSAELKKVYDQRKHGEDKVPLDLLFSSASGLDPHLSPSAAKYQVSRIALERDLSQEQIDALNDLIDKLTERRNFGFLGEERINVLKLNLAMDKISYE